MVLGFNVLCLNARLAFAMDLANDPIVIFVYRGVLIDHVKASNQLCVSLT